MRGGARTSGLSSRKELAPPATASWVTFNSEGHHAAVIPPTIPAIRGGACIAESVRDDGPANGAGVAADGDAAASFGTGSLKGAMSSAQTVSTGGSAKSMK